VRRTQKWHNSFVSGQECKSDFSTKLDDLPKFALGLGRVKTQAPAARTEYFEGIAEHESQIMLCT
jgi:hypothetical protein